MLAIIRRIHFIDEGRVGQIAVASADRSKRAGRHRRLLQFLYGDVAGPVAIIDIVVVVGDIVGDGGDLTFERCESVEAQILERDVGADGERQAGFGIARERRAVLIDERSVVLDDAFQRLPGEVHSPE